jgi:phosphomannomutase
VIELYCDLDTTFPNHQPDPERTENLQDLIVKVREEGADFGFAFDGDGDRIGIVNEEGEIFSADKIMYILAADFLSRNPGEAVVIDAMSSTALAEKIREIGGNPVFSKTGHSYIEEKMHEIPAKLGGEQSGHFMFGEDFYGHDDAILAGLRFITAIQNFPSLLSEIQVKWPTLIEFSEKFTVPDEEKFEILEKIRGILVEKYPDADTTDGVRVEFGNLEWGIIRCSNTSPKISIRIEAVDEKSLAKKKKELVGVLERFI